MKFPPTARSSKIFLYLDTLIDSVQFELEAEEMKHLRSLTARTLCSHKYNAK
jgi:hypothetical protein